MKRKLFLLVTSYLLLVTLLGCEAFVRKFTRKPKKDDQEGVEMVLAPQEYKSTMTKEEKYRQYLLFWKSWQDELITSLSTGNNTIEPNTKKQLECLDQAMRNLMGMRGLLNEQAGQKLDVYIGQMAELRSNIEKSPYGFGFSMERDFHKAERIRMNVLRSFSYNDIKSSMI